VRNLNILCSYFRTTVLYDQPPEFFSPASLQEKDEVNNDFTIIILIQKVIILQPLGLYTSRMAPKVSMTNEGIFSLCRNTNRALYFTIYEISTS
jgi:hypothetical protein